MYSPFLLIVFQCQYASCPLQKVRPDVHTDQILSENKYLCLPFCIAYFDNFSLYQNILKYNINNQQVNLIPQGLGVSFVCRRYHISKSSLMRWHKKFDGTRESLLEKSHRSHSKHLNAHTDEELKWIRNYHDAILKSLSMISMVNFGLLKDTPAILVLYTGSIPDWVTPAMRLLPKRNTDHSLMIPRLGLASNGTWVPTVCYSGTLHQKFFQIYSN